MKTFKIIGGISLMFLGLSMIVFVLLIFFKGDIDIFELTNLYIALFISALIATLGGACIVSGKKELTNEKEN